MRYSIIIPTYKLPLDLLQKAINSIINYTFLEDKEIIIVANGQTQEVIDYLKSLPFLRLLVFDKPLGYSKAVNEGLKIAKGEFVVLLNDDIELLPQFKDMWIGYLVEPFKENPDVGITGPLTAKISLSPEVEYEFVLFFCAMISRKVLLTIGVLDEGFEVGGYEDADFCIRAIKAKFQIQRVPNSNPTVVHISDTMFSGLFPIYHEGSFTMTKLTEPQGIYEKNFERLKSKHLEQNEGIIIGKYDQISFYEKPRYIFLKEYIEEWTIANRRKPKVLEIGCGSGYGTKLIRELITSYLGVDYDENLIKFAQIDYGDTNINFSCLNLEKEQTKLVELIKQNDIVVAFEVLEHIENLQEIFSLIATYSKDFVVSVPYNEPEENKWWCHKHIGLTENNFRIPFVGQKFAYQAWDGTVYQQPPTKDFVKTLIVYTLNKPRGYQILAYTVTRNRYATTLPLTILSLINQTRPPDKILIINDDKDFGWINSQLYDYLVKMLHEKRILFDIIANPSTGQVMAHQFVNREYGKNFDWVWRIDDDEVASPDVLEGLEMFVFENNKYNIGAVGPACRLPSMFFDKNLHPLNDFALSIKDIFLPNVQWSNYEQPIGVEHLHSTFLYRPNLVDYPTELSRIGHREETIFTYKLHKAGYKLFALPYLLVSHLQMPSGGLREESDSKMWEADEEHFRRFLKQYQIDYRPVKWVVLANGLGDIFAFKQILPELLEKYKNHQIVIACNIPEAFWDYPNLKFVRVETANKLIPNVERYNVYHWMAHNKWSGSIVEAFRRLYVG